MKQKNGVVTYHAPSRADWRAWLEQHHQQEKSVWLIIYRKESATPSVYYDEALCFGWVDSKRNKRDEESYFQFFSRRNPKSNWSRVNKQKVATLIEAGRVAEPGYEMVRLAQESGTWTALDEVENLLVSEDLQAALDQYEHAAQHFVKFPRSVKRGILEWIFNAKRSETRQKRIEETARLADQNLRANQYRKGKS